MNKRATGWWFVVRGDVAGWAPSSCLDLLNAPSQQDDVVGRTGTVLYDYVASGANELTIRLGDKVLVHSKHQHWLLAESDGRRGWVPSCYVTTGEPDCIHHWHVLSLDHSFLFLSAFFSFTRCPCRHGTLQLPILVRPLTFLLLLAFG